MRFRSALTAAVVVLAVCTLARGQDVPFKDLLAETLPGMGSANIPDNEQSQQRLQEACFQLGTPGREAQRAEACKLMAHKLGPETAKPARVWLLRQLQFIGREECVDALDGLLGDADLEIRDAARRALQANPAPEANARLLARLEAGGPANWRIALIGSLGYRGDPASVPALAKLLSDPDTAVAVAAAAAMGQVCNDQAAAVLAQALPKASASLRPALADGLLQWADCMADKNKLAEAASIYGQLAAAGQPRSVRLAALQGQLRSSGDKAVALALQWLSGDDDDARAIAAGWVEQLRPADLLSGFPKLPQKSQMLVLAGLAAKGDTSALPAAVAAAKSDNLDLKLAGLVALAKLGDGSVVPMLIEMASGSGEAGAPARQSLEQIPGPGVDEALVAALPSAGPPARKMLIEVLQKRKAVVAVGTLLSEAQGADADLRAAAVRALADLAGPQDAGALIALLLKAPKGRDRDELEKCVMFACGRADDAEKHAEPVLAVLAKADDAQRLLLLPVLGRIGGRQALEAIHLAVASDNTELKDAGVRALCNWPDAGVADELLKLLTTSENKAHQNAALRAYVRVISQTGKGGEAKTLDSFKKAMQIATREEDKKYILSRVANVRSAKTLKWVVPYLDDPVLATEASRAVVELAHRRELLEPNHKEFMAALKKVVEVCKDAGTVDRAKRIMQGL